MTDITTAAQMREAAAQWHDEQAKDAAEAADREFIISNRDDLIAQSYLHSDSAAAIRAIPCAEDADVDALRRQLAEAALDIMAADEQAANAYGAQLRAEAERDALKAEVARLREALERCPPDRPQMSDAQFRDAVNNWWRLWVIPALKGGKL